MNINEVKGINYKCLLKRKNVLYGQAMSRGSIEILSKRNPVGIKFLYIFFLRDSLRSNLVATIFLLELNLYNIVADPIR